MRKPACLICILDFNLTQYPDYFSTIQTTETEIDENLLKNAKYFFIELNKFDKQEHELVETLEKWTYFIKNAPNLEMIPSNVDDDGLKAAYLDADQQTWTKAERDSYDAFWVYLTDLAQRELLVSNKKAGKKDTKKGSIKVVKQQPSSSCWPCTDLPYPSQRSRPSPARAKPKSRTSWPELRTGSTIALHAAR